MTSCHGLGLGADGRNASGDRLSIGRAHVAYLAAWQHRDGDGHVRRPTLWERPSGEHRHRGRLLAAAIACLVLAVLVLLAWGMS